MRLFRICIFITAMGLGGAVLAATYPGASTHAGEMALSQDARSLALGGVLHAMYPAYSAAGNPALLTQDRRPQVVMSYLVMPVKERVVEEEELTYFNSRFYYTGPSFAASAPLGPLFSLGMAAYPVSDFLYEHDRNIFSSADPSQKESMAYVNSSGRLYAYSPCLSVCPADYFSFGLSWEFITGSRKRIEGYDNYLLDTSTTTRIDAKYSGSRPVVGLNFRTRENTSFGLFYRFPPSLSCEWDNTTAAGLTERDYTVKLPESWGACISHFYQESQATVYAEFIHTPWSYFHVTTSTSSEKAFYRDTTQVRIGLEHVLAESLMIRYGLTYLPFYGNRAVEQVQVTAGLGYSMRENVTFDVAAAYGKSQFQGFFTTADRVDETIVRIMLTGGIRF